MRVVFVLLILFETINISSQTKQTRSLVYEIVDQLILSDNLQANIFNGNYNTNDVRNVLKDNRIHYKAFYFKLRNSVDEDFSNTVNYAYSRANFLFDENEEVIYWLNEYSTYLRGLKNRINNNLQPNYLAKNNSKPESIRNKTNTAEKPLTPIDKKVTSKKGAIEKFNANQTTTVISIESLEKIKEETIVKERSSNSNIKVQETKIDETTTEEIVETIEETTTEFVEEEPLEPTPEKTVEIIKETTTEEIVETIEETTTEFIEEVPLEPTPEETVETIKETTTKEIVEIIEETSTEFIEEEPIDSNPEEIVETIKETTTKEIVETIEETSTEFIEGEPVESTPEEIVETIKETTTQKIVETKTDENPFVKQQPIKAKESKFELSYSAKLENELANKAVLYYTVRVKSVSNPRDGLKFLSEIKDDDAVWDEHTFHLFKDKENKNITNISIGKFVDKENAEELMAYLKTKNITNPSIEIHENNVRSTASNVQPISKPRNTTRTAIENPVNKVVKSPEEKKEVSSNKNLLDNISSKVDDSENYFSVQVGANNKISSTNIQGLNLDKEKLFFVNIEKGKYAMNYGKHEDYGSAHKIALEIHKKGLQTAFVTKYENGVRVKISKKDYSTDKTPKEIISDDINQLGYIPIGPNDKGKFIQIGTIYNWDAHNFKPLYDQLERTIYYKIKENNSVIFLVGPLQENEVFIELRNVKQLISDAFIKTIY
jgi:hypothetical protein